MRAITSCLILLTSALTWACASPSSPSDPASIPADRLVEGQAVNAIDGTGTSGLTVQVQSARPVTTDAAGYFRAEIDRPGSYETTISGTSIVERRTRIAGPTTERARLSLIPASFDLRAYDEMFRASNSRLQRWTTQPALVLLASVMTYRGVAEEYPASAEQLTDDEVAQMIAHLTEGLRLLTGGTHNSFSDIVIERPAQGTRVRVMRTGYIVVGRYNGVQTFANTIGYGGWEEAPDGSVTGGSMFLDRNFDKDDNRRRLLRIHELGHALGYLHVESRTSIMNPAIGPEPTDFDRSAAMIAFQRPVGNIAPDADPMGSSGGPGTRARWTMVPN
jgi:hypothetical protein